MCESIPRNICDWQSGESIDRIVSLYPHNYKRVKFPTELAIVQVVFAVVQMSSTESYDAVEATDPVTPVVVAISINLILTPAGCAIFHPHAHFPTTRTIFPTAEVAGSVAVTSAALLSIYPVLIAIACEVPVTSV